MFFFILNLNETIFSVLEYNESYAPKSPMFNYTEVSVYTIVISVSDLKTNPTSTCTFTVSIDYVDKPAVWTSLPAIVQVREDVTYGPTPLMTVGAIDPNGLYPITYTWLQTSPASGGVKFYFNSTSYEVGYVLNPNFVYGNISSYQLQFTAHNTIDPTITSSLVVEILPVRNGPEFQLQHTVYIHENTKGGFTLWDIRAKDNFSLAIDYRLEYTSPYTTDKFQVTSIGCEHYFSSFIFNIFFYFFYFSNPL